MKKALIIGLASLAGASQAVTYITDFEAFNTSAASGTVMFCNPTYSGSTSGNIESSPNKTSIVAADVGGNSTKKLKVEWKFKNSTNTWLRLTTYNTTNLPNPAVDFNQLLLFDIYTNIDLQLGVGIRETATDKPIGGNGGTSNGIEFVSNVPITGNPGSGQLITAGSWVTVVLNLANAGNAGGPYVKAFAGTTANGVLSSQNGMGVLEHLYFVPVGNAGPFEVYLDNFRQEAVPEPMTMIGLGVGLGALVLRRRKK